MKSDQNKKETIANAEYDRLVKLFTDAGVDKIKVEIYSELIRKVASFLVLHHASATMRLISFL